MKGCAFHWFQAVMRKVTKLGLKTSNDQKKSVHLFVRKLLALPYLPSDHIKPAFKPATSDNSFSFSSHQSTHDLPDQHMVQQQSVDSVAMVCVSVYTYENNKANNKVPKLQEI
jgi:hypothetical protein